MSKLPSRILSPKTLTEVVLRSDKSNTGKPDDYKDHTDPNYVGPGTWNSGHRLSIKAITKSLQLEFIKYWTEICQTYPCHKCRDDSLLYIKNHPMEDYLNVDVILDNGQVKKLGLFVWMWNFHNYVNAKLNKPKMSWDTVYNMYSEDQELICGLSCLNAK